MYNSSLMRNEKRSSYENIVLGKDTKPVKKTIITMAMKIQ